LTEAKTGDKIGDNQTPKKTPKEAEGGEGGRDRLWLWREEDNSIYGSKVLKAKLIKQKLMSKAGLRTERMARRHPTVNTYIGKEKQTPKSQSRANFSLDR
jgi:hypothetical protein